jgi:putative tryptophan/tyrosine transport system substrate-binding protein
VTNRRAFISAAAAGVLLLSRFAAAQPARKVVRIGWLTPSDIEIHVRSFRDAMRALGYVEGQTYTIETRSAGNDLDRLPTLAAELVNLKVDIIVAVSPPAIVAAKQASATIPIVMAFWGGGGLVESGVVANLARPGGNVTGVSMLAVELEAKRLEYLLQAVPKARIVGVLDPGSGYTFSEIRAVAERGGVQLRFATVGQGSDAYLRAFDVLKDARVEALLVPSSPRLFRDSRMIIDLAAARHIPAIYEWPDMADVGGLMAYGPTFAELDSRVASFVQRIMNGASPAVLAIEQPSKFELVVNLRTAKALGFTFPPPLLLRADRVIQ